MEVVAVTGFQPTDPKFFERFAQMGVRPSRFGVVVAEGRANIANDVARDRGASASRRGIRAS